MVSFFIPFIQGEDKMKRLDINSTLKELMSDKKARAILEKHFGETLDNPLIKRGYHKTLKELYIALPAKISKKTFEQIEKALNQK